MEKRVRKELKDIMKTGVAGFEQLQVQDSNILLWEGLIVPHKVPYNKGAFKISITFPTEYPFKPPKVIFKTKIYHPNVDEKGNVCLAVINSENWKPATKITQVLEALILLVNDPEPSHPLRAELATEFTNSHSKFLKKAEDATRKHGEKRPSQTPS